MEKTITITKTIAETAKVLLEATTQNETVVCISKNPSEIFFYFLTAFFSYDFYGANKCQYKEAYKNIEIYRKYSDSSDGFSIHFLEPGERQIYGQRIANTIILCDF